MRIGICSPIATALLRDWLEESSRAIADSLSRTDAPAVTTIAEEFLKMGHYLVVFTLDPLANQRYTLIGKSISIYVAPAYSKTKMIRRFDSFGRGIILLRKMFKESHEEIDVLSAHWTRDYAIASGYFRKKCPVFVTVRDIMPYILKQNKGIRNYPIYLNYIKNEYVMRMSHIHLIANSDYTAEMVKRYWGHEIPVIYNPIKEDYLKFKHQSNALSCNGIYKIVSISISSPDDKRKNILTLLRAHQMIMLERKDIQLLLVGKSFSTSNPVIKQWEKEGLLQGVVLLGNLSHEKVLDLLKECDLMVHPSIEETFGNTLIEAMACECPIIGGKKSGAVPYVLEQGKAGCLSDVSNQRELSHDILEVFNSPEKIKKQVEYAKKRCIDFFSSKKIAEKYIELFRSQIDLKTN